MRLTISATARQWAATLVLMLLVTACGGLGGEPEIIATRPRPTAGPPENDFPTQPPDLVAGAAIFAERCIACHGESGAGDGELVRTGQIVNAANFTLAETAQNQTPKAWFNTITNGRLDKLMPPWGDVLSAQERWNVGLYTFTLAYSQEQIVSGEAAWNAVCGDSCDSLAGIGSLIDQQAMVSVSNADLRAALPNSISQTDAWNVVAYLRTRGLSNANVVGQTPQQPIATEEARVEAPDVEAAGVEAPASVIGVVSGQIVNGSAGGDLPDGLPVRLFTWDAEFSLSTHDTTSGPDGSYAFADIELSALNAYAVTADYRQRRFASDLVRGDSTSDTLDLPLTIYELTEDPAVITISGLVNQITALGTGLQIVQIMNFQNTSDRVYTSSNQVAENKFASLVLNLPPGASVIGFPNNEERYIVAEDQTTVVDTVPVLPGQDHLIQMVYLVPYAGDAIIEYPVNYALDGQVRVLVRPESLNVLSNNLAAIGPQLIGETTYTGFGGDLSLSAEDVISYEVRGDAAPSAARLEPQAITGNNLVLITVIMLVGLALLIASLFVYYQRRGQAQDKGPLIDALVQQIGELDATHDQGDINHDLYQHQRGILKARLAELMSDDYESE